jgi:hypothetical protein
MLGNQFNKDECTSNSMNHSIAFMLHFCEDQNKARDDHHRRKSFDSREGRPEEIEISLFQIVHQSQSRFFRFE